MKKIKRILKCSILLIFVILLGIKSYAITDISWYCKRNKNHEQPMLDSKLKFVENYDVYWIDKRYDENSEEKVIYLTFDAGYENGNVEKIVDVLNDENVKAGFFVLENILVKNKELMEKIILGGHTIANHTANHKDVTKMSSKEDLKKELKDLENTFERLYGCSMPKIYRPPEGKFNEKTLKWTSELGYKTVMWSFAYADWDNDRQMSQEKAMEKILENIHNGEVMLLHPTSSTNAEIIKDLIKELKVQGYRFGSLEELCTQ